MTKPDDCQTAAITTALPFSIVLLLTCWSTIIAFNRERPAYDKAERDVLLEHVGAYYGLEVDAPAQAGSKGLARPWEAVKRRVRGTRGGSVAGADASASAVVAEPLLRVDVVSPDPAIDGRLDEGAPGTTDQDDSTGR